MIKRIMLMDSHAQASVVVKAIKNRILELNAQKDLSKDEARERALLNEAYERMSSHGKEIPSSVTPSTWDDWAESDHESMYV